MSPWLGLTEDDTFIFDIRPENEYIVLRGRPVETEGFKVKGTVVIMTTKPFQLRDIKVKLKAWQKVQFVGVKSHETFMDMTQDLDSIGRFGIKHFDAGNHAFPFEFDLKGDVPESVEGYGDNFIIYQLKAIASKGILGRKEMARRRIRIIRTPSLDALAEGDARSDDVGDAREYLHYSVTHPTSAIFGTHIDVEFGMTPKIPKTYVKGIMLKLVEYKIVRLPFRQDFEDDYTVAIHRERDPTWSEEIDPTLQLPMKTLKARLDLPKTFRGCRQSVQDGQKLRIVHKLFYEVEIFRPNIDNPLALTNNHVVTIFISPNVVLPGDGMSMNPVSAPIEPDDINRPPPSYGEHRIDLLYEGVETYGSISASQSEASTPFRSRNPSQVNLALNPLPISPTALASGLSSIRIDQVPGSRPDSPEEDHFEPRVRTPRQRSIASSEGVPAVSGAATSTIPEEDETAHPELRTSLPARADYNMEALSRRPSYGTAMRSNAPTPVEERPPSYAAECYTRPATPENDLGPPAAPITSTIAEEPTDVEHALSPNPLTSERRGQ